ncbi:unnamed protein product [marine sediment metagenome]|uniref:Uncharacterized protein n=1 Tax=marine sediment metagenome TaxID=412755 RepID=X0UFM4_9ZZZZ
MTERSDTRKPEQIVMLRRRKDGPVQQLKRTALIPAIKRGKLLRTDEYSIDGISWSQLDHHPQLKKIFDEMESTAQPPSSGEGKM